MSEPNDNPNMPLEVMKKLLAIQDVAAGLITGAVATNSNPNANQAPITLKGVQDVMDMMKGTPYPNPYMRGGMMSIPNDPASYIHEILGRISYKPGWNIRIYADAWSHSVKVVVTYEGYESENAAFAPLSYENATVSGARERLAISLGKTVRKRSPLSFSRMFDFYQLERMRPEEIIRYVIGDTLKQAEMFEFERWFKYEGCPVFEHRDCNSPQQDAYSSPWSSMVEFTQEMPIEEVKKRWPYTPVPGEVK